MGLWHSIKRFWRARSMEAMIADPALRKRCADVLLSPPYDRAIREACVVLEDRVRRETGADAHLFGVALMQHAFDPQRGMLRLSASDAEQRGVLSLYVGIIAFFRNPIGHRLMDHYTKQDARRFVLWIDVLLALLSQSMVRAPPVSTEEANQATQVLEPPPGPQTEKSAGEMLAFLKLVD